MSELELAQPLQRLALGHALTEALRSSLSCGMIIKDHIEVFDANLCALAQKAQQVSDTDIELDAKVLVRICAFLEELIILLIVPDIVRSLFFLKNFEHGDVLLHKVGKPLAKASDQSQGPPLECHKFKDVEDEHPIAANQVCHTSLPLNWLRI